MAYRTFLVPIYHAAAAEEELNRFLGGHQVLAVEKRWLENGENSAWCFFGNRNTGFRVAAAQGDRENSNGLNRPILESRIAGKAGTAAGRQ